MRAQTINTKLSRLSQKNKNKEKEREHFSSLETESRFILFLLLFILVVWLKFELYVVNKWFELCQIGVQANWKIVHGTLRSALLVMELCTRYFFHARHKWKWKQVQ